MPVRILNKLNNVKMLIKFNLSQLQDFYIRYLIGIFN